MSLYEETYYSSSCVSLYEETYCSSSCVIFLLNTFLESQCCLDHQVSVLSKKTRDLRPMCSLILVSGKVEEMSIVELA